MVSKLDAELKFDTLTVPVVLYFLFNPLFSFGLFSHSFRGVQFSHEESFRAEDMSNVIGTRDVNANNACEKAETTSALSSTIISTRGGCSGDMSEPSGEDISPSMTSRDAAELLRRLYGLEALDLSEFVSYDDRNFLVSVRRPDSSDGRDAGLLNCDLQVC
jgi:hypothetical protein